MIAFLSLAFLPMAISSAGAQEGNFAHRSPVPKFSLSASVQDTVLNRDDSRFQSPGILSGSAPLPVLPSAPQNLAGLNQKSNPRVPLAQTELTPTSDIDRPNSYLEEYQVNWSPWIGHLASNWHEILKGCEEVLAVQFHTARPALIQFTCYADGHIGNVVLRQSSGIPVYDRLQIAALMEVRPLPFPKGTVRHAVTLIQGWESHTKQPGEEDFKPWNFANQFPQERVNRWVSPQ